MNAANWREARPADGAPRVRMPAELQSGRTFYTLDEVEEANARGYRDGKAYGRNTGLILGWVSASAVIFGLIVAAELLARVVL